VEKGEDIHRLFSGNLKAVKVEITALNVNSFNVRIHENNPGAYRTVNRRQPVHSSQGETLYFRRRIGYKWLLVRATVGADVLHGSRCQSTWQLSMPVIVMDFFKAVTFYFHFNPHYKPQLVLATCCGI
jgi:hypothetical protein